MIINSDSAAVLSRSLLQIKAVKLSPSKPFTWASGWKSPIYCDSRLTLSYPKVRTFIRQQFTRFIQDTYENIDVIAGVATGAIAHGALVAQELGLPFIYIRSSEKGHGLQNLVEGHLEQGQSVVIIEDIVSTGKSSMNACNAIKEKGGVIKGVLSIFNYGFPEASGIFSKAGIEVFAICDYSNLLDEALKQELIQKNELETLLEWKRNPADWGKGVL